MYNQYNRKTKEDFQKQLFEKFPDLEVIGEYINSKTKILLKCKKCGYEWNVTPNNVMNSKGCKKCVQKKNADAKRKTLHSLIQEFKETHGDKYDYSKVNYVNYDEKVEIICPIHGSFWQTPDNHIHNHGCPKCNFEKQKLQQTYTQDQFIQKCKEVHGDKYLYNKTKYTKSHDKVIITCKKHGDFEQKAYLHLQGNGCPLCNGGVKLNTQQFINKAKEIHGELYDYSKVNYVDHKTKVKIICKKHGEFLCRPNDHLSKKSGCPICSKSHGEQIVEQFLNKLNVSFQTQYPIDIDSDIRANGKTYIDFYLPKYNLFIEYNGVQHYKPVQHFGGILKFNQQQLRDNYVKSYCESKNIRLLEISYKLSEIEIFNVLKSNLL